MQNIYLRLYSAPMLNFSDQLAQAVLQTHAPLCVGIDPHPGLLPPGDPAERALQFGLQVIEVVQGQVPAIKPQFAFFEAMGIPGMTALSEICRQATRAGLLVVGDAKRGDIASTARAYASAVLGPNAPFPCHAITVSPYLGADSIEPFLQAADHDWGGVFVLVRTSNPGAEGWQARIADEVADWVEKASAARCGACGLGNVGAVVGATWPGAIAHFRKKMPHSWLLMPGIGAQGGQIADLREAFTSTGLGVLAVGARSLTLPDEPCLDVRPFVQNRLKEMLHHLQRVWPCS